MNCNKYL